MNSYCYHYKGKLHREDGPAIIEETNIGRCTYISESWYKKGKLHRDLMPAVVIRRKDNDLVVRNEFWVKGKLQRPEGLPTIVENYEDGIKNEVDAISTMSQEYCGSKGQPKKDIVLLSGEINTGKNQVYDYLVPMLEEQGKKVEHLYFAERLKNMCDDTFTRYAENIRHTINDVLWHVTDDEARKKLLDLNIKSDNWYEDKTVSTRLLLQDIGTKFVRDYINKDYWIECVSDAIEESDADVIIITDFRFANEYEVLERLIDNDKYNIKTLRVERSVETDSVIKHHTSENSLKGFNFDSIINNDGTLSQLRQEVKIWVDRLKTVDVIREWE